MTQVTSHQDPISAVPKVSIVVPCYNSAWCIEDTLRTIRAQTFRDFELLIINDGSTDDIHSILAPHQAADSRVRVVDQENRGLAGARNRGLAEARGELIGFIDSDDIWHPTFLELAVEHLDADPQAPFAFAYSFRFDELNRYWGPTLWNKPPRHDLIGMATVNLVGNGSAAVFRRDLVAKIGGFDESMRTRGAHGAEDWKLCLQLADLGEPSLIPESLVGYRSVAGSMSQGDPARQKRAVEMVVADLKAGPSRVPPHVWKDGMVTMNGWLLPAFLRQWQFDIVFRLLVESYVKNPGWVRSPVLWRLHVMRVQGMLIGLKARMAGKKLGPIGDVRDPDGSMPYAILADIVREPRKPKKVDTPQVRQRSLFRRADRISGSD